MTDDEDETVAFSDTRAADLFIIAAIGIGLGVVTMLLIAGAMYGLSLLIPQTWPWWD